MTRIDLTGADLEANRQGRLSVAQRRKVQALRLAALAGALGLLLTGLALAALVLLKLNRPAFARRGELLIVVPVLLFWMWLLRAMPRRWRLAARDVHNGEVATVTGVVVRELDFGVGLFKATYHTIQVAGRTFRVPPDVQRQFREGPAYRVYHTPHAGYFLGALLLVGDEEKNTKVPVPQMEPLTPREREVLQLIARGLSNRQIADQMALSVNTVKMYASQLYRKLGVGSRTEAAARAHELDLI